MNYELNILENAVDSLNEALSKYNEGQSGNVKAHKFSILHFCHFMELMLKHYIASINENLIYSPVFKSVSKKSKENSISLINAFYVLEQEGFDFELPIKGNPNPYTITVDQALSFVASDEEYFDKDLALEIRAIKDLRNNIEHHKFSMNPKEVRLALGRLTRGFDLFTDVFNIVGLSDIIAKEHLGVFRMLADEYEHELQEAKIEVQEAHKAAFRGVRPKFYYEVNWQTYDCPDCGNAGLMIPDLNSLTGFKCTYCGNEESDDIEVECEICGSNWPIGDMTSWEDSYSYTCPDCNDFESKP